MDIITDHKPREILDAHDLTVKEWREFPYISWERIERAEDSASFIRYRGEIYDLNDCERSSIPGWDGMYTETFFSGVLVRYSDDGETVVMGRYCT